MNPPFVSHNGDYVNLTELWNYGIMANNQGGRGAS